MKLLRKNIALVYLLVLVIGTILSLYIPKTESAQAKDTVIIPSDAIRLRILANSDKTEDQDLKRLVRDEVNKEITKWVQDLTSKEEARKVIEGNQGQIQEIAENVVKEQGFTQEVKVKFGPAKFPTKLYGQYLYPAGSYEAIVITLGDGEGANWWCVLYPPLCFLDFSNGTAVSQSPYEEEAAHDNVDPVETDQADGKREKEQEPSEPQQQPEEQTVETEQSEEQPVETGRTDEQPAETERSEEQSVEDKQEQPVGTELQPQQESPVSTTEKSAPVYTTQDEEPVKVKFLLVELFTDLFS
ncbi:stage II sporulation protein R [Peribacillus deserti]|uniref:Stage II sporulation protein R n=1 Tax=Peribacillus deserti TaxID=673318 RepID=A0A2N5MBK5_9BACI|nr:stage II sporulation protein R [Peribacillus deserti]PLT31685.1 stage II sporulation protein R [Peribacillus deserti]